MLVSQDLFRVQVPAGVTGGADDVSPCTAALPSAPGVGAEFGAASGEDDISIEALLGGSARGGAQMRTKWVAGYSANAAVGLLAGLGLANWGFDAIPVSGLAAPGTCGVVAGVALTVLALACVGAAIYAGIRPERLPGWWPSRSALVLRGLNWVIGDLVAGLVSMRPVRARDGSAASDDSAVPAEVLAGSMAGSGANPTAASGDSPESMAGSAAATTAAAARVARCGVGPRVSSSATRSRPRTRAEATPKYGPQGIFTRSGAPIIRAAIR